MYFVTCPIFMAQFAFKNIQGTGGPRQMRVKHPLAEGRCVG